MQSTARVWSAILGGLIAAALLPRCSCEEGETIRRAAVEMQLSFIETDSCSGAMVPRLIPDDYARTGQAPSTDFGSRGTRRFELRSVGSAPLTVSSIALSAADPEFTLGVLDGAGMPASFPTLIAASRDPAAPPGLVLEVAYAASDSEPDLLELVIVTDDPERTEVRFGLTAGRGSAKVEVCPANGCAAGSTLDMGDVPVGGEGTADVKITNEGEGDLDLRSIRLESASAEFCAAEATEIPEGVPDCALVAQCMVLRPGESYTIRVRYRPEDGGSDTGKITIVSGDAARGNVEIEIQGRGAGPALCTCVVDGAVCTPAQLVDFGQADVGASVARTVRLVSCGTDAADLDEATLEDDPQNPFFTGPEFQITAAFSTGRLEPGTYAEGVITYRPGSGGAHRGGLRYRMGTSELRAWIGLVGQASTCDIEVLPTTVGFGTVAGGSSAERAVLLANNGGRECSVTAITDPSNGFSLVNRPALPLAIGAGRSVTLTVRFSPPAGPLMPYSSSFDVTSSEPGSGATTTVALSGTGGGTPLCEVNVSPNNPSQFSSRDGVLNFGAVSIGYRQMQSIRIENVGNTDCVLESYALMSIAASQFQVSSTPPPRATIRPGAAHLIEVTFAPTMESPTGMYTPFAHAVNFSLSGSGLTQTSWSIGLFAQPVRPTIDVLPQSLDFGVVTWQSPQPPDNRSACGSVTRSVNVYNSGTGALQVSSIAIDPSSDPVFLIESVRQNGAARSPPYNNITMNAGESMEIRLRFFPSRATPAEHMGLLVIDNSVTNPMGSGAPLTVPLRGEGTINAQQTDVFHQLADNKIDILWVVDDSCSMSEEQQALAQNFQGFINFADSLNVDYQVGVTTTEVNDAPAGKLWACSGFNKILTRSDANRVQAFECAANVTSPPGGNRRPNPTGSDEQEAGLQAARIALDVPVVGTDNAGFLRDDARLAVITVSDEEDQSDGQVNLYIDFFRNLKGFANPQLVSLSAIAGDVPGGCATAAAGQRYNAAAGGLNGQFESICSQSWQAMLQNIGLGVFALRQAWGLSRPADPSTLVVRVNGQSVSQNPTNGWTFDAASNTIHFNGNAVPPPGSTIEVQYGSICLP